MKKHLFLLLFAVEASVGTLFAQSVEVNGIWYNFDNSTKTAEVAKSSYTGSVIIPASVEYNSTTYSVTSIGDYAFSHCYRLTSVTIPNSVTSIGESAFESCTNLTSVTIPNSVTSIGDYAFFGCTSLNSIEIPNSVTSIGERAFYYCSGLTSVTIGNSVTSIGERAFESCTNLTSVTIPNSVISIGGDAFSDCSSLTSVIWNAIDCGTHGSFDWFCPPFKNCPNITSFTIGDKVKTIPDGLCCRLPITSIEIPNSVTSIGYQAFSGCSSLTSVTIPNSVASIGETAFSGCSSLTDPVYNAHVFACLPTSYSGSYSIPDGIVSIAGGAFLNCSALTSVTIPISVTSINHCRFSSTFSGCSSLASVIWNAKKCTNSGDFGIQVESFVFGNEVESIPVSCCSGMSKLTSIIIPNSVTSIGNDAFKSCSGLTSIVVENGNTVYDSRNNSNAIIETATNTLVVGCKNTIVPNSVTSIGKEAFYNCSGLTNVTIGNGVTSIGERAFYLCKSLKNIIFGSSVKVLEDKAFYDCSAMETITCYSQRPPTVNNNALGSLGYSTIVYVPANYLNTYKMHDAWGLYDVRPLGATNVETTEVEVTPSETTAEIVWPVVSGAATYELVIKDKNGNVICTLVFNAQGQLTTIAFNAPARNNAPQQTQSTGFSFTVTGLESGTSYDLTMTAKDGNDTTLQEKTMSFKTTGDQAIDEISTVNSQLSTKIVRDGQLYIERGSKLYNAQGARVE